MNRNIPAIADRSYDVIVVGAGIYGCTVTCSLARAGLTVLLLDKGDFCAATSANSLKILHGGLRYLQHLNIRRMRETIVARSSLMRFSPHLTRPLACMIPTRGHGFRSRPAMAVASVLNNWISADRNRDLPPDCRLADGQTLSRQQFMSQVADLAQPEVTGGVVWHDGLAVNSERLALEYILTACDLGASACNYLRADRICIAANKVEGLEVTDLIGGESYHLQARWIVNAAGPWFDDLLRCSGVAVQPTRWAKAVNLVVNKTLNSRFAVGLEGQAGYQDHDAVIKRDKRFFFFVPWRGGTMIGTTYHLWTGEKERIQATREDIEEIVAEVNSLYPAWQLRSDEVSFVHCGLLPMSDTHAADDDQVQLAKHSLIIDHRSNGGPAGLLSLRSIKYTTAPVEAQKVVRLITASEPHVTRTAQAAEALVFDKPAGEKAELMGMLQSRYGRWAERVLGYVQGDEPEKWWLHRAPDVLCGEVLYFMGEESAQTLADVIFRRTDLGTFESPSHALLSAIASLMAQELGWNAERVAREIEQVQAVYSPLSVAHSSGAQQGA